MAALLHLSTFSKYLIPLGNFIFPLIIWTLHKKDSFIDSHGRQAINFQISMFLYMIFVSLAGIASIAFLAFGQGMISENTFLLEEHLEMELRNNSSILFIISASLTLLFGLFLLELFCVIKATIRGGEGRYYNYPLSISFIPLAKPTGTSEE